MRVILAKTLLVVFLALLPFQQAQSQPAPSTNNSTGAFIGDFIYRTFAFQGMYVTFFCRTNTDHCLNLAAGSAVFSALVSYAVQGTARSRCNKTEGESAWCAFPGADSDFTHQR